MATYTTDQVAGKTLMARRAVKLFRYPRETDKPIYTVQAGQSVGTVYSHVGGKTEPLWWQFDDANGKSYYAKHENGAFDEKNLIAQGALNVEQEYQEKKKKEAENSSMFPSIPSVPNPFEGFGESLEKTVKTVAIVGGIVFIASILLKEK